MILKIKAVYCNAIGEDSMVCTSISQDCGNWSNAYGNFLWYYCGAGVAQRYCNGLPCDGPGFDARWGRCKNRASRPSQGTVNWDAVSK